MKNLLFIIFCTAVHGAFAQETQQAQLIIKEIPPLPVVEITAELVPPDVEQEFARWHGCIIGSRNPNYGYYGKENDLLRKYDTSAELIFMSDSDVWMADPSARSR